MSKKNRQRPRKNTKRQPPKQNTPQQPTPKQPTPKQHAPRQPSPKQHKPKQHKPKQQIAQQRAPEQPTPKQHKPNQTTPKQQTAAKANTCSGWINRRNAIKILLGVPVVGVAGAAIHRYDVQTKNLHDLSVVGQGSPVVVQVHDPACQLCRRLMNNTREVLEGRTDIVYRVADITYTAGASFQQKHNAGIVTLLVFNAQGKRVDSIQGVTSVNELKQRFNAL